MRRSWLTAASSAVRIRSASASGPRRRGLLGEALLAQRDGGLGGERLDDAPVGGGQRPAAQHQGEVVVDGHVGVALAGCAAAAGSPTVAATRQAAGSSLAGPGRAAASGPRSSRVTDVRPNVSRSRSSSAGSGRAPRSTLPATVARVCGVGAGPGGLPGAAGGEVDHRADRDRDDQEDDQGEQVLPLGDGQACSSGGVKK